MRLSAHPGSDGANVPARLRSFSVVVDPDVERFLGAPTLGSCLRNLWPVTCRTCTGRLDAEAELSVHRSPCDTTAVLALHHPRCRASAVQPRRGTPAGDAGGPATLSGVHSPGRGRMPVVVVNPSCDELTIRRRSSGGWRITALDTYRDLGFGRAGGWVAGMVTVPPPGGRLQVRFPSQPPDRQILTLPAGEQAVAAAVRAGRIEMLVGTKFYPPGVSASGALSLRDDPEVLGGRLPLVG